MLGLLLVVGLVTIIMSSKNWHWTQLTLVLLIFFSGIGYMFLGASTLKLHRRFRSNIAKYEKQLEEIERQNYELQYGTRDLPGIGELEHRLQIVTRERGRVWRGVLPSGQVSPLGEVAIQVSQPVPHGLEQDSIVYAFETGDPNTSSPQGGPQYLGEFRVKAVQAGGAMLESTLLLGQRELQRIGGSQGPWSLYETMPVDRHSLFAEMSEEEKRQKLPAESVEEYLRHGTDATPDDDQWHVIGLDDKGNRVGKDNLDAAVKKLYNRTLRDYAYLFNEMAKERIVAIAKITAVAEDNQKLVTSLEGAEKTGEFRRQQIDSLEKDLTGMKADRLAIESHRDSVLSLLAHYQGRIEEYLKANSLLAKRYSQSQLGLASFINASAPAP